MSEASQEPFRYPSNADNLNWDDSTTFRHVNGVTVYEQQEPDSKEATYMVSASVHATPEDCLKVSFCLLVSICQPAALQSCWPAGEGIGLLVSALCQPVLSFLPHAKAVL